MDISVESVTPGKQETIEDLQNLSFEAWSLRSIVDARSAWEFQKMLREHYQSVLKEMKMKWAEEVCWGKDRLRERIEKLELSNDTLMGMNEAMKEQICKVEFERDQALSDLEELRNTY